MDEYIWFYHKNKYLHTLLKSFNNDAGKYERDTSVEVSVNKYLGIVIDKLPVSQGGRFKFHHSSLIDKLLATTVRMELNWNTTTTSSEKPISKNDNGKLAWFHSKWYYASVVGMMMYLMSNYRLNIQFKVHQCVRLTHNYKDSHEENILHNFCYLKETSKYGLILEHRNNIQSDCCVEKDSMDI